ncbi:MAG TPA: alpha/beta hydrolase [Parafilimonas sp.]|nr:alpha/beta hydrolase [Parafilimonas sp.]
MKKICTAFFIVLPILFSSINKAFSNFYSQLNTDSMPTGNYANVNGIKMYYEIYGEGEPLVLIHGGGSTIQTTFEKILPTLVQHYKCIAVELQAHGRTSDRNAPESFTQDADDVAALLKQLNFNKASFFGFSNGASTTMQIAIRHPELVDKIIVVAGAYKREGFIPGFFDGFKHATLETMPQGLRDAFLKVNPDSAALLNMFNKDVARMVAFKDWSDEDLKSIKAPALIINADKDVILPEHALKMSQLIPNARLIILPGVHGECIGEIETASLNSKQPEMVVELVKEFLDK